MTSTLMDKIWASIPVPAVVYDAKDFIYEVNPAAEDFFNTSRKSLLGNYLWQRLQVDQKLKKKFTNARQNSSHLFVNEVKLSIINSSICLCNLKLAPILNDKGSMLLLISPKELAGRMTQTQTFKSASKSAIGMAEMLAHEIKNPLAGITGAAQLLSMGLSSEDLELTDLIVEESRRIVKLLEQVEQFGNLQTPNLKEVNLHDILGRARRSAELGYAAHMRFIEDYDPSLPSVHGDVDQLLQVLLNLIKNAAEAASADGGTITLRTFYEHSFKIRWADDTGSSLPLQVEICDDGPGLPEDIKSDIFDPFVSGKENGTGLGLALANKIINDHKGWLSVASDPGKTIFRISLPCAPVSLCYKD